MLMLQHAEHVHVIYQSRDRDFAKCSENGRIHPRHPDELQVLVGFSAEDVQTPGDDRCERLPRMRGDGKDFEGARSILRMSVKPAYGILPKASSNAQIHHTAEEQLTDMQRCEFYQVAGVRAELNLSSMI